MFKSIQLKLAKIKYRGDSIGDDIRVEIEILGKFLRIDKRIKVGASAEVNQEVGRFETDQELFYAEVMIAVVEKDLLFNDVGSIKEEIKVNTVVTKPQQFIFEIKVRETRSISGKFWGKAAAVFEISLEAEVSDVVKYVPDRDEMYGWLAVKFEDDRSVESLPAYLKVKFERADTKREYFTILEGPHRGRLASVKLRDDGSSWFFTKVQHEPMIHVKYSISQKNFILKDKKYKTVDYPGTLWKKGLYDIEMPDYPHRGGRNYLNQSKRAMTWFRIGHGGERYLHTGSQSLGCMTIIETKRWMKIYNSLIKARKSDFMSVGVLEIID